MCIYLLRLYPMVMWLSRNQPKVILYHACEEKESDFIRDLRSNTPPAVLARHLDFLSRHYTVVPLRSLAEGVVPKRAVVITFDDGYRSVYSNALPLLVARGLPATVYLVTSVIGNPAKVWVNELNRLVRLAPVAVGGRIAERLGLPPDASAESVVRAAHAGYDPALVALLLRELRAGIGSDWPDAAGEARLYLSWEEIEEMASLRITFGNHTATHPSLPRLTEAQQRREMAEARAVIRARLGECDSFSYPFGDVDEAARRCALELGHTTILEVGGCNAPFDRRRLARVPVHGVTDAELFAEIEVVAPLKGLLRRWLGRLTRSASAPPPGPEPAQLAIAANATRPG
jgi:peptidoglycan/xylan/chitin deacetylase (PgdA/CDA1 family)